MSRNTLRPRKVLYIVEGQDDEPALVRKLHEVCFATEDRDFEIYVYDTNIHQLVPQLFIGDQLDEYLDIRLTLKSQERDPEKIALLNQTFNEIYMFFDFDPQQTDNRRNAEKDFAQFRVMLQYYQDPILPGKLYINYPMIEACRHLSCLPDLSFDSRKVTHADVLHYKEIVHNQCHMSLRSISLYTFCTFFSLAVHHVRKAIILLGGSGDRLSAESFIEIDYVKLFDIQVNLWLEHDECYVLNTSLFRMIDYNPKAFFTQLCTHPSTFLT